MEIFGFCTVPAIFFDDPFSVTQLTFVQVRQQRKYMRYVFPRHRVMRHFALAVISVVCLNSCMTVAVDCRIWTLATVPRPSRTVTHFMKALILNLSLTSNYNTHNTAHE